VAVPAAPHDRPATRILIVEDEFLIALALEDMLLDAGHAVVGMATTYDEAVALAAETRPALVLMDIRLASERDGIDAAIEIERSLGIPSLFTSANLDPDNMERARTASPVGWVPKPYSPEVINDAVARALSEIGRP
jgi:two-component system, response regulator PdtaR